jgi:hypothetical protein
MPADAPGLAEQLLFDQKLLDAGIVDDQSPLCCSASARHPSRQIYADSDRHPHMAPATIADTLELIKVTLFSLDSWYLACCGPVKSFATRPGQFSEVFISIRARTLSPGEVSGARMGKTSRTPTEICFQTSVADASRAISRSYRS